MSRRRLCALGTIALLGLVRTIDAQKPVPNLHTNVDRPLRYRPEGSDFVIDNGPEFFNRPLYGGNTAFRVDGGDKPEFVLYLPGRGGNLRLGLARGADMKWLHTAARITTRYRPGELLYEIHDPLLGGGRLSVAAIASRAAEALLVRIEGKDVPPGTELLWAYGGVNGERGRRGGDIGTEAVPISEWFQLKPEFCRGNRIDIEGSRFTLRATVGSVTGVGPAGSRLSLANAALWNDPRALFDRNVEADIATPVVIGRAPIATSTPTFLALRRDVAQGGSSGIFDDPSRAFAEAEDQFSALRGRVSVDTPDPFLNAAVGALNVAADAVWDEPQNAIMHGAIAWRTKLLGWRGPYALDALGWTDRARAHFESWSAVQNQSDVPGVIPPPDENANLARSERALHSNGDLSNSHYDMNAVYIDALFRHLLWTGDLDLARRLWPVIERHLAWERRLFRREFGPAKLPLYEAYAMIWASDDLQYSGGGTTHASAYNYFHNRMAARIAALVGADPAPYSREADLIARGMRDLLWMKDRGMFAESKDWLGTQSLHPAAALWSFYVTMDSRFPTADEAKRMARYVDTEIPHLPVRGEGVPPSLHTLATTNWMPYTWSINNVVMAEAVHGALGFWQAGRSEDAWRIVKGSLLAAMFMGITPGNVGSMSYLDVYRRESQRDFADGSGVLSRAIVEGLFGVRPDALASELTLAPGFPREWNHAKLHHPRLDVEFERDGAIETFVVRSRFAQPMTLRLQAPRWGARATVTVNGQSARGGLIEDAGERVEVLTPIKGEARIAIRWSGPRPPNAADESERTPRGAIPTRASPRRASTSRFDTVDMASRFNDRITEIFRPAKYLSPRSPFVSLALPSQGIGAWAGGVNAGADIDDTGLREAAGPNGRFHLDESLAFATPGPGTANNVAFVSQWDNYPRSIMIPLAGRAAAIHVLMAGSTNPMQSRMDNGEIVVEYSSGAASRLALRNPETWWPIEQDYLVDDYQFPLEGPLPIRVDLKTGRVRALDLATFKGQGGPVPGGAATVLSLPLDPRRELKSITVRALANDVVIGLMAATLSRPVEAIR